MSNTKNNNITGEAREEQTQETLQMLQKYTGSSKNMTINANGTLAYNTLPTTKRNSGTSVYVELRALLSPTSERQLQYHVNAYVNAVNQQQQQLQNSNGLQDFSITNNRQSPAFADSLSILPARSSRTQIQQQQINNAQQRKNMNSSRERKLLASINQSSSNQLAASRFNKIQSGLLPSQNINLPNVPERCFQYSIGEGNNSELVRRVMRETRDRNWFESTSLQGSHFRWQARSAGYAYREAELEERVFNHFEFHRELTDKSNLLQNLLQHCNKFKLNAFAYTPVSFLFDIEDSNFERDMKEFLIFYSQAHELCTRTAKGAAKVGKATSKSSQSKKSTAESFLSPEKLKNATTAWNSVNYVLQKNFPEAVRISRSLNSMKCGQSFAGASQGRQLNGDTTLPTTFMTETFLNGKNVWVFKPSDMNRGRGVQMFRRLSELQQLIVNSFMYGAEEVSYGEESVIASVNESTTVQSIMPTSSVPNTVQQVQQGSSPRSASPAATTQKIKNYVQNKKGFTKFVLQKYLEQPCLIRNRKFDIRVWTLLTNVSTNQDFLVYMFKEGYIRTSSHNFELTEKSLQNRFVHLTNNAVQKHSKNYGDFEDGNQLSYKDFKNYISYEQQREATDFDKIIEKFREMIVLSIKSARFKLNKLKRKNCFEIFGYDFIIDKDMRPWLIEINTNPCIEESSKLLKNLLPRMIDDALRLTIDKLYKTETDELIPSIYTVEGHSNNTNLWELLNFN